MYFANHQAIADFELHRPATAAEAAALRRDLGGDAAWLAGGTDLIPAMRGGSRPQHIIWLGGLRDFSAITVGDTEIRAGAGAPYGALAGPEVAAALPDLAAAWAPVANARVRSWGTLGGNIMAGNPTYDALPALIALGATFDFVDADGAETSVAAGDPMPGDALLMAVRWPKGGTVGGNRRFALDRTLKPAISVAVGLARQGETISIRAGLGCAWPAAVAMTLDGLSDPSELAAAVERAATDLPEPLDDHNAGAAYRRRMAAVLTRRLAEGLMA